MKDHFGMKVDFVKPNAFVRLFLLVSVLFTTNLGWGKTLPAEIFKESERILVGEIPVTVIPRREYLMKAGATGEITLTHGLGKIHYRAGEQLGGIDLEAFSLQKELLEIEEALIMDRRLPQAQIQKDIKYAKEFFKK